MPRGIPKDPNHPRNKKQSANAGAAPKRRGRPPGSKNLKHTAKVPAAIQQHLDEAAGVSAYGKTGFGVGTTTVNLPLTTKIDIVRENVRVLSAAAGSAAAATLVQQVDLLGQLTSQAVNGDQHEDLSHDEAPEYDAAPAPVATIAPLPSFVPPPPFPQ